LTVYAGAASSGSPNGDFTNDWNEFVVKPFKAGPTPKTQIQTLPDGWQVSVGGANIELDGGIKAAAVLTVFSGFGKTASVLVIFNDESYSEQASALIDAIKLDKTVAASLPPQRDVSQSGLSTGDPFPDRPGIQPQQPLIGQLKESITMADLTGEWSTGDAVVTSYVNSSNGNYAGTDTTIALASYTIRSDGTFEQRFTGRTSNHTVREKSTGTITLSNGFIILRTTAGDGKGTMVKFQFISYMVVPNGAVVITLIRVGYDLNAQGYTPEQMMYACDHAHGFIMCGPSGENWSRKPNR
ncbi:MAG: hypothetical protein ACRD43_10030, partial [Pyrinomonadaceae bacterium]